MRKSPGLDGLKGSFLSRLFSTANPVAHSRFQPISG